MESIPRGMLSIIGPIYVGETCAFPVITLADGPIFGAYAYNATWDDIEQQGLSTPARGHVAMPTAPAGPRI